MEWTGLDAVGAIGNSEHERPLRRLATGAGIVDYPVVVARVVGGERHLHLKRAKWPGVSAADTPGVLNGRPHARGWSSTFWTSSLSCLRNEAVGSASFLATAVMAFFKMASTSGR